jgi:hypothetical protein
MKLKDEPMENAVQICESWFGLCLSDKPVITFWRNQIKLDLYDTQTGPIVGHAPIEWEVPFET